MRYSDDEVVSSGEELQHFERQARPLQREGAADVLHQGEAKAVQVGRRAQVAVQGARRLSSGADDGLLLPSASSRNGIRRSTWRSAGGDVPLPALLVAAVLGEQDEMRRVSERQRCVPLSLRDVGTEMTPGGSKEPSRANTPRAHVPSPGRFAAVATSRRWRRGESWRGSWERRSGA